MKDLYNDFKPVISHYSLLRIAAAPGDVGLDLAGFEGALVVVTAGVIAAGGTYTWGVRECDTLGGTYTAVAAADLLGAAIVFVPADANTAKRIGYIGAKQFIRVDLETVGGTPGTGGLFTGIVIKGKPRHAPVA